MTVMNAGELNLSALSKTLEGEDLIYQNLYETISKEIQKHFGSLVKAEDKEDFRIMVPTGVNVLYIHMPFCDTYCRSCPYSKSADLQLIEEYCDNLIKEMELVYPYTEGVDMTPPSTLFIGGGTPSIIPVDTLERVMKKIHELYIKDADIEITIEANPKSTTIEKIQRWSQMGINRISLGVQSFNQATLNYYNRNHGPEISEELCKYLTEIKFNYSVDLLFGHDGQELDDFLRDIRKAASLQVPHITIYPFHDTIQNGEKYQKQKAMYDAGIALLKELGYIQYSIVDFHSKDGKESGYSTPYKQSALSFGAGALGSSLDYGAYAKVDKVKAYNERISQGLPAFYKTKERKKEKVNIFSLYCITIDRAAFTRLYGEDPYMEDKAFFDLLESIGHVTIDDENITLKNLFRQSQISYYCLYGDMLGQQIGEK